MAWIEQRGSRYRVVWRDGADRPGINCATKAEAKRVKAEIETDQHRGTYINPNAGKITVEAWAELWLSARSGVKRSSDAADRSRMANHIVGRLGDKQLDEITPITVRRWIVDLEQDMAPKTVRNCHALLHSLLASAVEERLIPRNPCVKSGGRRKSSLPAVPRREMHFLEHDEIDAAIEHIPDEYREWLLTMLATGWRWGEAAGFLRRRARPAQRVLQVRHTLTDVDGVLMLEEPKTKNAIRDTAVPQALIDELKPLLDGPPDGHLFMTPRGKLLRDDNFRDRVWKPMLARAGLPPTVRIHDLRHTHAAHLISANVPLLAVSKRLGHASIQITADIYGHLLQEVDERVVQAVESMVSRPRAEASIEDAAHFLPTLVETKNPQAEAI
jgi:integrase